MIDALFGGRSPAHQPGPGAANRRITSSSSQTDMTFSTRLLTSSPRERKLVPMTTLYRYSFDKRLVAFWGVFGVRPAKDGVTLTDDGRLRASFGLLKLETTLENVDGAHITRNYRWWTAAGARASLKDDGLTFGTNAHAGVCIHFREKVPSPLRRRGHSALTVTVEDVEALTEALTRR